MSFRRRMMAAKGASEYYIQDGLVFWLDGFWNKRQGIHDNNQLYLNDLTNNHVLTWDGNISFEENGARFNKNVCAHFSSDIIKDAINSNTATIELLIKPIGKGKGFNSGYIALGNSVRGFWIWDNNSFALASFSYRTNNYAQLNKQSWSLQKSVFYISHKNGILSIYDQNGVNTNISSLNSDNITNSTNLIGAIIDERYTSNFILYGVRIYNRVLSDDELSNNFEIDKKRFNLVFE